MQLIACRDKTLGVVVPSSISSSYAKIAYCGLGWIGVIVTDISIFLTLFGVCVSTLLNIAALCNDMLQPPTAPVIVPPNTPTNTFSADTQAAMTQTQGSILSSMSLDSYILIAALATYPLVCLKNMTMLAKLSPIGIICLALNVGAIVGYGLALYGTQLFAPGHEHISLWPQSPPDLASYTGIAIFCFGICSLALQVEESMENSQEFGVALLRCLLIVCGVYFFVGDLVALLYSHDVQGVNGNILLNLPDDAFISNFSRVAMVAVSADLTEYTRLKVILLVCFRMCMCVGVYIVLAANVSTPGEYIRAATDECW
jgi:uncharacterized membrane protein